MSPQDDKEHVESVIRYNELKEDIAIVDFRLEICKDYRARSALETLKDILVKAKKEEQKEGF